jgi:hypothetical protein
VAAPGGAMASVMAQEVVPVPGAVAAPAEPGEPGAVAAAPVPADMSVTTGLDTVTLRDGGVIRGTIAESFPGRHVTIVSAAGQSHTIEWERVADVNYGGVAAVPVAIPPPMVGPGRPRLHIELSREATVRLYELTGTIVVASGGWGSTSSASASQARPVCIAPCDKVIDGTGGQSFFFGGDRITPSRRFTLQAHDGEMTAVVKPGRVGVFIGGAMLTTLSLAPLLSGAVFVGFRSSSSSSNLQRTGAALVGVGAGFLISGIIMLVAGRTRVELYKRVTGAAQRRGRATVAL